MAVIEYFISGILCIFQNQMECHFFFPREMGDITVLVSHSNPILHGKQDEWAWEFPEEKRRDRNGERRSFFMLSSPHQPGLTGSFSSQYLNPLSPGWLQQLTEDASNSLIPVWSLHHVETKSQVTSSIPVFPRNTEPQPWKICSQVFLHVLSPRYSFL